MLQDRIAELIALHGSLRAAARVLECDPGYLSRLQSGEKENPEDWLLRRMKLRRIVTYERSDAASPSTTQQQEVGSGKWGTLYRSVNEMIAQLGADGEISARSDRVSAVMDALHELDGGIFREELAASPSTTRQQEVGSAPEGFRLLPVEATDAMMYADWDVTMSDAHSNGGVSAAAWRAMVEAAPQVTYGNGHSGVGWYMHDTDYPEEGAVFLGAAAPSTPEKAGGVSDQPKEADRG